MRSQHDTHVLWLTLVLFGAINLIAPAVAKYCDVQSVAVICQAYLVGQYSPVIAFGALYGASYFGRILVSSQFAVILFLTAWMGIVFTDTRNEPAINALRLLLFLPCLLLSAQVPVWGMWLLRGWTIVGRCAVQHSHRQFDIRQLFALTTVIAVALSLARLVIAPPAGPGWQFLLISCIAAVVYGALVTLPAIAAAFGAPSPVVGASRLAAYGFTLSLAVTMAATTITGSRNAGHIFLTWCFVMFGLLTPAFGSFAIARSYGYELRRREKPLNTMESSTSELSVSSAPLV